ncbi:hypothetical protein BDV95DRAFT_561684 [Massariosphaeria phaeospora]|uniref:RRM domain-containing protein n=1 Tax=Massariosphaeria phaeospora TaxID=100035 RepID=A0A7C8MHZ7_9PLEO|nr:hypothetical protein BDV95DRAFT_561684 [Massariosphaeria phaeospora]
MRTAAMPPRVCTGKVKPRPGLYSRARSSDSVSSAMDTVSSAVDSDQEQLVKSDVLAALLDRVPKVVCCPPELGEHLGDRANADIEHDPKQMMADLERTMAACGIVSTLDEDDEDDEDDLTELQAKITTLLFGTPHAPYRELAPSSRMQLEPKDQISEQIGACTPSQVALQLERAGYTWVKLATLTAVLFSTGVHGYKALRQEDMIVKQAHEELDKIVAQALEEEMTFRELDEKARLPCRIVVSNIAADAEMDDLLDFFHDFVSDILEITFLETRDPVKRTRTAYIDMCTSDAAQQASHAYGYIFGLSVEVELASSGLK